MPNISGSKKALRSSKRKYQKNLIWKNKIKDSKKNLLNSLLSKGAKLEDVTKQLNIVKKTLDKASRFGSIHKNKAARLKSRLDKRVLSWAKLTKNNLKAKKNELSPAKKSKN